MNYIFSFEDKVVEYFVKVSELGRNLNENDNFTFTNNDNMHIWYKNESKKIMEEVNSNIKINTRRLHNIMLFAKLEDYIFDLNKKEEKK